MFLFDSKCFESKQIRIECNDMANEQYESMRESLGVDYIIELVLNIVMVKKALHESVGYFIVL